MKPKIIFIVNSIQQQRCIKRIEEFIANGYEIQAYGFNRAKAIPTSPQNFQIEVVGQFENSMSYLKRMILMYRALKPIFRQHAEENVIYYYFLLDVAMICRTLCKKPYIYEESDLMHSLLPTKLLRYIFDCIDKSVIHHSLLTVMTSEGFAKYHFGEKIPENLFFIPNRLNKKVLSLSYESTPIDINHLRFAIVGSARSSYLANFIKTLLSHYPQHEFHFYGVIDDNTDFRYILGTFSNAHVHGIFSNPTDLPSIYKNIDLVLATYNAKSINAQYAEPNKLYEAIYFETPIIVSSGTFLAQKVQHLSVGYSINALDSNDVISFIEHLTIESINQCKDNCRKINKNELVNDNPLFFERLNSLL